MKITYADQKDLDRAKDLKLQILSKGMDKAIGSSRKMAKLIKDPEKLLRRTEAVLHEDFRLVGPFIERCREIKGETLGSRLIEYKLQELVTAYDTGRTVGKYATSLPREYGSQYELNQESFIAGFVETYGYNRYIGTTRYGI